MKLSAVVTAPARGLKRFVQVRFRRESWRVLWSGRSRIDFAKEVGDGLGSSTVAAPILWVARTFPEAPPKIWREDEDGQEDRVRDHPVLRLMQRPNPYFTGPVMWMATTTDWQADGNAYWLKQRSKLGDVVELWWTPSWMMAPKGDESTFITHYEYSVDGEIYSVRPEDVVHFRFGIDPDDPRRGYSPLKSVLREVFTDDEAAAFTASLLRNMGVPGLIVSPKSWEGAGPSQDEVDETKSYIKDTFTGDRRGEPLVLGGPTDVHAFGFSPEQLTLRELRRIPEERVTAVLGIPAIVAGLGAGLDRSTFCMPGDARVWTPAGPQEIRDVKPGQIVWSYAEGGLEPRRVKDAGCTGVKPLVELRTKNRTIRATGNHPFLVRVPGTSTTRNEERSALVEWRPAGEIKPGDHIVQAKSLPDQGCETLPDGNPATEQMMMFLGAVVGDGTVSTAGVRLAMPPADRCVAVYRDMARSLFTKQTRSSGGGVEMQERVERAPIVLQERERDFGFSSAAAARTLVALGLGGRAHSKRVPSWVWTMSRHLRLAFLAGLVDTDGHIDKRGALTFTFCNRALTYDVRDLLVSVGIQASNVGRKIISASALPNKGTRETYEAWTCTASSAAAVAEISFADPLYRERVEANAARHREDGFDARKAGLSDDLGFYEVKQVRSLPAEPIYDLEIEGSHSFVADGAVVHNTNMGEAREAAYEAGIIPMQRILAEEIRFQLLREYLDEDEIWSTFFGFDLSKVRVLQEDLYRQQQRLDLAVRGGWAMVSEARRTAGYVVDADRDDVFIRQANTTEVRGDGSGAIRSYAPARASRNGNGNGAAYLEHPGVETSDDIADKVVRALERGGYAALT